MDIPTWGWIALGVLAILAIPLKLRVWKRIVESATKRNQPIDDE